jgi:protein-tyrosine phosphatase
MIDLHVHLLPFLDHGPSSWEEALEMARMAVDDGITAIAATPHRNFQFRPTQDRIRAAAGELRNRLEEGGIPLEILVGADYHLTPELISSMEDIITLGDNGRYFLLELPELVVPPNILDILAIFIDKGLTPIITHPERNQHLRRKPGLVKDMAASGCPVQITADSLRGVFGDPVMEAARTFISNGMAHILASDAHWADERPPVLSPALPLVEELSGVETAERLVRDNPARIIRGDDFH